MKQLITLLLLSCILFSCNKPSDEDEYYTVTGQVLDLAANYQSQEQKHICFALAIVL